MDIIKKPFTEEQVNNLNFYQFQGSFHPFTCANDGDEAHIKYEFDKKHKGENYEEYLESEKMKGINFPEMSFNETNLIATENGWVCPVCDYKQDWAHSFMAKK